MQRTKLSINPRTLLTSIKIPWNITQQQLQYAIIGAILFSLSACLYFFIFGKLIGRTSLVQLIQIIKEAPQVSVYITVLSGVVFCSAFVKQLYHQHFINFYPFDTRNFVRDSEQAVLAIAGLMVGVGTGLAGGCTFGHGISGLARGQRASFLSVIIFFTTAHLVNRWKIVEQIPIEWSQKIQLNLPSNLNANWYINGSLVVPFLFFIVFKDKSVKGMVKYMLNFLIGVLFALGMMVGGLTKRQMVLQAFNFNSKYWNPTIIIFFAITIIIASIILGYMIRNNVTPVFAGSIQNPKQQVSFSLIFGSVCFGVGWGLGGMCPGSMYAVIPLPNLKVLFYWGLSCIVGFKIADIMKKVGNKLFGSSKQSKSDGRQKKV